MIAGALVVCVILGLLLYGSARLKNRVETARMSPAAAYEAAREAVARNPAIHDAVKFSSQQETTLEHWDPPRWRVSGYVDTQPKGGAKVRTLYFCVVRYSGQRWDVEDMQLQSMEIPGSGPRSRPGR